LVKKFGFPSLNRWWTPSPGESTGNRDILKIGQEDPMFADRFKGLRAKFEYKTDMLNFRVVGVTSSIAGDGKTLNCAFLANSLAQTGRHKVLLVDTDIRKADLTRGLSISRSPGLTELLSGNATLKDIVRDSHVPDLKLIAAGAEVKSPADLLAGDAFRDFLKEVRERYDIVLLDTPPVLAVADTVTMREQLDAFVFIFRASYTPVSLFRQAVEEIGEKKILGVVVNAVEPQSKKYMDKYYGYYYHQKPPGMESVA
jgi:tyrosine-protein kinase Etk/Wzc